MEGRAAGEWRIHWAVVLAAALGVSTCVVHLYTAGLFLAPIEAELGWSRAEIASGLTVQSAVGVLFAPLAGRLADLFGPRRIGLGGLFLYGAAFGSIGSAGSLAAWWTSWALLGIGWAFISPPIWAAAIAPRFDRGRGLALAISLCGGGVTLILAPLLADWSIAQIGWRASYGAIALLWLVVAAPVVARFFLDPTPASADAGASPARPSWRQSGCFTRNFLMILIAGTLANGIIVTLTVHFVPILAQRELAGVEAAGIASLIGVAAIGGRLVTGLLLDRLPAWQVAGTAFLLPAITAGLLISSGSTMQAAAAALVLGLAFGAEFDIVAYLVSRRFSLANFGTLFGILTGFLTLAGGSGPLLAGRLFDQSGSYAPFLAGTIVAALGASILIVAASRAKAPDERPHPVVNWGRT